MEKNKKSLTIFSVLVGIAGAAFISLTSFYIILKSGLLLWTPVAATLLSIGTFRLFSRKDTPEIIAVHTIMSTGATIARSVAFTLPGYIILGGNGLSSLNKLYVFMTILIGSCLGVFLSFILRKKMIEDEKIEFPLGIFTYILANSAKKKGSMKFIGTGTLIGSSLIFFRTYIFSKIPEIPFLKIFSIKNIPSIVYTSPILLGIGYVLKFSITSIWFFSSLFINVIARSVASLHSIRNFADMKISLGIGLISGIGISIFLKVLLDERKDYAKAEEDKSKNKESGKDKEPHSPSFRSSVVSLILALIGTLVIWKFYHMPFVISAILVAVCILCLFTVIYFTGKVGINPMEIYVIIIMLIFSFLNKLLNNLNIGGRIFTTNITMVTLFTAACIISVACGIAADSLNDFKSGYSMKLNPVEQLLAKLMGIISSSAVTSLLFFIFLNNNRLAALTSLSGNVNLHFLQPSFFAPAVTGIPHMPLFWIGLLLGAVLNMSNVPVFAIGIGIYLPFYMTLIAFIGGLLKVVCGRISKKFYNDVLLFLGGIISGGAVVEIGMAMKDYIKFLLKM